MTNWKQGMTLAAMVAAMAIVGCGGTGGERAAETPEAAAPTAEQAQANAVTETGTGVRVALTVTDEGFVPASVNIPAGRPVTLAVTRKTDRTCATELILKDYAIDLKLPLDQTVEATFTPTQPGALTYACGMDMIKGTLVVQ
jgi:plastocyanin domain-containing protein